MMTSRRVRCALKGRGKKREGNVQAESGGQEGLASNTTAAVPTRAYLTRLRGGRKNDAKLSGPDGHTERRKEYSAGGVS